MPKMLSREGAQRADTGEDQAATIQTAIANAFISSLSCHQRRTSLPNQTVNKWEADTVMALDGGYDYDSKIASPLQRFAGSKLSGLDRDRTSSTHY